MKQIVFSVLVLNAAPPVAGAAASAPLHPSGAASSPVAATAAPAALEIAVIHKEGERLLLWPMFPVPARNVPEAALSNPCHDGGMTCPLGRQEVMRRLQMKTVPAQWIAADGSVFITGEGYYANNLLGGLSDDFLGFTLRGTYHAGNVAVSNIAGVFAPMTRRELTGVRGIDYGKRLIDKWKREYTATCGEQCDPHLNDISSADKLTGTLTEYRLAGGAILQYLDLSSFTWVDKQERKRQFAERVYQSYLHHVLWRRVEANGKTTVLHAGPELVSYDCDGRCFFAWDTSPDVIEYGKTIRVVGKGGGGEVFGYYIYQFRQGRMALVTGKTGGS